MKCVHKYFIVKQQLCRYKYVGIRCTSILKRRRWIIWQVNIFHLFARHLRAFMDAIVVAPSVAWDRQRDQQWDRHTDKQKDEDGWMDRKKKSWQDDIPVCGSRKEISLRLVLRRVPLNAPDIQPHMTKKLRFFRAQLLYMRAYTYV